ncbi:MAG: LysM peptidoglycan-binding domain-containing protein [Chloroflexi bacterium]|nr:LysM peptidoglycan-binding domain-containing protein [Chloroflexota bacterium]
MPAPGVNCAPTKPNGWLKYTVQTGDTLYALAKRSDVSVEDLMRTNCLTETTLIAGQTTLFIPGP